jgi:cell division transport system permease protein
MSILFFIRQAFGRIVGRWHQNVAYILCVAVGFLVLGSFLLLVVNLEGLNDQIRGEVQIEVYLKEEITLLQLYMLFQGINGFREVDRVQYRSQKEALTQMENLLGAGAVKGLEPGTLPASLLLSLKKGHKGFKQVEKLALELRGNEGVEDVEFGAAWLKKVERIKYAVILTLTVFGIIISFILVTVMSNCLRSVVRSQTTVIRTMKLLGANVREASVFLSMQGLLIGGAGALTGVLCLRLVSAAFAGKVPIVELLPASLIFALIGWGMIWGVLGILLFGRKQLRA